MSIQINPISRIDMLHWINYYKKATSVILFLITDIRLLTCNTFRPLLFHNKKLYFYREFYVCCQCDSEKAVYFLSLSDKLYIRRIQDVQDVVFPDVGAQWSNYWKPDRMEYIYIGHQREVAPTKPNLWDLELRENFLDFLLCWQCIHY